MREVLRRALVPALLLLALTVVAVGLLTQPRSAPDRAYSLEQRLRCPVCKSVSVADSPSQTATAMRQDVAQQIAQGRSDEQILDFFRARYGDWVVLAPPFAGTTLLVWLLPPVALLAGLVVLLRLPRRTRVPPLPEAERERVRSELATYGPADAWDDEP